MNIPCDIILDLIPLVKDNVASESSNDIVLEHLKSCESCMFEFDNYGSTNQRKEVDDKKVLSSIRKKLLFITSAIGIFVGLILNKSTSQNYMLIIMITLSIVMVGILIFKFNSKGEESMRKFFIGRTIGTIIIFALLGIYLLIKYML